MGVLIVMGIGGILGFVVGAIVADHETIRDAVKGRDWMRKIDLRKRIVWCENEANELKRQLQQVEANAELRAQRAARKRARTYEE